MTQITFLKPQSHYSVIIALSLYNIKLYKFYQKVGTALA